MFPFLTILALLILIIYLIWRVPTTSAYDRYRDEQMAKIFAPDEDVDPPHMPPMIFLTDEILEIHERYKALRAVDRFSSRDITNDTGDELFYAVLDLIDPEYWKGFEIVPSHSTGDAP